MPPEYRLFFDAPILAAYRYASRPFDLKLALQPAGAGRFAQPGRGPGLAYQTRISKEGQALTDVRYFVKNRGNPNFRLTLPQGAQLWSASVNGAPAVPVSDGQASLIPLPQSADPNAVLELDLKLASKSANAEKVTVNAPIADAPVMLAEWTLAPDPGQRLVYQSGDLRPARAAPDVSGFAQLARLWEGRGTGTCLTLLCAVLVLLTLALALRRAARAGAGKYGASHLCILSLGLIAFAIVLGCAAQLAQLAGAARGSAPAGLAFLAPVQQPGSALQIAVSNLADKTALAAVLGWGWPALAALLLWAGGWMAGTPLQKLAAAVVGWTLLAWAALRFPNGAPAFFWILPAFLVCHVLFPALRQFSRWPRKPAAAPTVPSSGAAPATLALLTAGLYWMSCGHGLVLGAEAPSAKSAPIAAPAIPDSVTQTIRVEDKLALATAKIRWQALKGQALPLLSEPAVLTHVVFPARSLKLQPAPAGSKFSQQVVAQENGVFDLEVQYEIRVSPDQSGAGFALPSPYGLINRLSLTVVNLDVDVLSPQAVSIKCDHATSNTVATLILSPADSTISWRPRSRDVKREKPVFYAEMAQLYVPSGGVVEGAHAVSIRPAQGELAELTFDVPPGATVTDVIDPAQPGNGAAAPAPAWRFDPDTRKLRVALNPALSRPFALLIRSQVATGPLPYAQSLGLVTVDNAAGQIVGRPASPPAMKSNWTPSPPTPCRPSTWRISPWMPPPPFGVKFRD